MSQIAHVVEEIEEEDLEEEVKDEVYVMLRSSIVGVQYYKGIFLDSTGNYRTDTYDQASWVAGRKSGWFDSLIINTIGGCCFSRGRYVQPTVHGLCRNAIQVKNIGGTQVGHIPRNVASKLAPLMDNGFITVEGVMHEGNCECFSPGKFHS